MELVLDQLDRRNQREQDQLELQQALSHLVLLPAMSQTAQKGWNDLIAFYTDRIRRSYKPFEKEEITLDVQTHKVTTATGMWESNYDMDLDDPAVQKRIDDVAQGLNALRVSTARAVQSGAM